MAGRPVSDAAQPGRWPPGPGLITLRTDARLLVVERSDGACWQLGIGEAAPQAFRGDPRQLEPVDLHALIQLIASQLVRVVNIAERAQVSPVTVEKWRRRYPDQFPAPVNEVPQWWWPDLVAAGFDRPRRPGRPRHVPAPAPASNPASNENPAEDDQHGQDSST